VRACALAVPDCRPIVAAPNNIAAPSAIETKVFMSSFPFRVSNPPFTFGNDHASHNEETTSPAKAPRRKETV